MHSIFKFCFRTKITIIFALAAIDQCLSIGRSHKVHWFTIIWASKTFKPPTSFEDLRKKIRRNVTTFFISNGIVCFRSKKNWCNVTTAWTKILNLPCLKQYTFLSIKLLYFWRRQCFAASYAKLYHLLFFSPSKEKKNYFVGDIGWSKQMFFIEIKMNAKKTYRNWLRFPLLEFFSISAPEK